MHRVWRAEHRHGTPTPCRPCAAGTGQSPPAGTIQGTPRTDPEKPAPTSRGGPSPARQEATYEVRNRSQPRDPRHPGQSRWEDEERTAERRTHRFEYAHRPRTSRARRRRDRGGGGGERRTPRPLARGHGPDDARPRRRRGDARPGADRSPERLDPQAVGAQRGGPVPAPLRDLDDPQRQFIEHQRLQHLRTGPRRGRPQRHPDLLQRLSRGRLHRGRRRPRQHLDHLHRERQGRAHLLAERQQGRGRLRGLLRRLLGRRGERQERVGEQPDPCHQLSVYRMQPQRHRGSGSERCLACARSLKCATRGAELTHLGLRTALLRQRQRGQQHHPALLRAVAGVPGRHRGGRCRHAARSGGRSRFDGRLRRAEPLLERGHRRVQVPRRVEALEQKLADDALSQCEPRRHRDERAHRGAREARRPRHPRALGQRRHVRIDRERDHRRAPGLLHRRVGRRARDAHGQRQALQRGPLAQRVRRWQAEGRHEEHRRHHGRAHRRREAQRQVPLAQRRGSVGRERLRARARGDTQLAPHRRAGGRRRHHPQRDRRPRLRPGRGALRLSRREARQRAPRSPSRRW